MVEKEDKKPTHAELLRFMEDLWDNVDETKIEIIVSNGSDGDKIIEKLIDEAFK